MLAEKSSSGTGPTKGSWRYPPTAAGIQCNFCRNPCCGRTSAYHPIWRSPEAARARTTNPKPLSPGTTAVVAVGKDVPALMCLLCSEVFPMHSNLAVAQELMRISAYLDPIWPACPNEGCALYGKLDEASGSRHTRYGANRHGTPRYKCGACKPRSLHLAGALTNASATPTITGSSFSTSSTRSLSGGLRKLLGISTSVSSTPALDFIHRQCQLFAGEHEARPGGQGSDLGSRYTSRLTGKTCWSTARPSACGRWASTPRCCPIASAEQDSGYVYAANLNFD